MFSYSIHTSSAAETAKLAAKLGPQLRAGDVVALVGNLAAGKTTFVQGLARAYKVEEYASSPTFTYINEYNSPTIKLIHIDAYRLNNGEELIAMGLWEYFEEEAVILIEWADIVSSALPPESIHMRLKADPKDEQLRHIEIDSPRELDLEL
jgi:tRNA threonylcarbamoyladenosine biosynthesis protein TsaE